MKNIKSKKNHLNSIAFGPNSNSGVGETPLDANTLQDLIGMFSEHPIFKMALKSFLSRVLAEPFTFSIPAIGMKNNKDMERIIVAYWMPWLRMAYKVAKIVGLVPYYFKALKGAPEHKIPVIPEFEKGYITVSINDDHETEYKWYWNHGTQTQAEKNMLWIITEDAPDSNGAIRSALASLLPSYRSLLKLRKAQDVASTQAARPVHIVEYTPSAKTAIDDDLTHLVADFDKAAGIGKARRDMMEQQQIRMKTAAMYKQMQETHNANTVKSTIQPTLWTDTPSDLLEEMDAGFSNRVVSMLPDRKYSSAAKPSLVADYTKSEAAFNTMAAAVMDFALEMLTPTGSSRAQNDKGAERYAKERNQEQTQFFISILQPAIVIAYYDRFKLALDMNRTERIKNLGGDPNKVSYLYPELDVIVDMSGSIVTEYEELKELWMDGFMSKETAGMHAFKNKNIPLEQMQISIFPDKYPKELLLKNSETKTKEIKKTKASTPKRPKAESNGDADEKAKKKRPKKEEVKEGGEGEKKE